MSISEPVQLSLGVSLSDDARFNNFYAAYDINRQAVTALQSLVQTEAANSLIIWGARVSGLTHLLQALCHDAYAAQRAAQYLPIGDLMGYDPHEICEGLEAFEIICLDGIELICGNRAWEQAIFHLYNNVRDAGHSIVIASHSSPPSLPIMLPDLKSRILAAIFYHIESLQDEDKKAALRLRAQGRGLEMPEEVAAFILNRAARDMGELVEILDLIDEASLQEKRKLSIPFVKEVLGY